MSTNYFLIPRAPADWRAELHDYVTRLTARWPQAAVEPASERDTVHALKWMMTAGSERVDGSLLRDRRTSRCNGSPELFAAYVLWFRREFPRPELMVVSDADGAVLEVTANTSAQEIATWLVTA